MGQRDVKIYKRNPPIQLAKFQQAVGGRHFGFIAQVCSYILSDNCPVPPTYTQQTRLLWQGIMEV
jgi:hypothetical protein